MPRRINAKKHQKAFKQTNSHKDKKVANVKPYPIPDLEGQLAKEFEKKIRESPTEIRKKVLCEASAVFSRTKMRK